MSQFIYIKIDSSCIASPITYLSIRCIQSKCARQKSRKSGKMKTFLFSNKFLISLFQLSKCTFSPHSAGCISCPEYLRTGMALGKNLGDVRQIAPNCWAVPKFEVSKGRKNMIGIKILKICQFCSFYILNLTLARE